MNKSKLKKSLPASEQQRDEALQSAIALESELEATRQMALRFEQEANELRKSIGAKLESDLSMQASTAHSLFSTLASRLASKEPRLAELARMGLRSAESMRESLIKLTAELGQTEPEVHGIVESLAQLVKAWGAKEPTLRIEFLSEPKSADKFGVPEAPIEPLVVRVAEAAIDRAVNAGGAHLVVVSVMRGKTRLRLQVIDDGAAPSTGLGHHWKALLEKAKSHDGTLSLDKGDSGGAEVLLSLPWLRKV